MTRQTMKFFIIAITLSFASQTNYAADTSTTTSANTNSNNDLINERFTVDRALLEKHWRIDCDQAVTTTLTWLTEQSPLKQKLWDGLHWKDLNYCGLLFNTVDTGRYEPCPNYLRAYQLLSNMRQSIVDFNEQRIRETLSVQCSVK